MEIIEFTFRDIRRAAVHALENTCIGRVLVEPDEQGNGGTKKDERSEI
jgi:hypothetical protein